MKSRVYKITPVAAAFAMALGAVSAPSQSASAPNVGDEPNQSVYEPLQPSTAMQERVDDLGVAKPKDPKPWGQVWPQTTFTEICPCNP